ncbi:MAG: glycoside hydrolase family 88 protein [Saprospiraceae bacterium]|nr:glycoside hydrolase family 88 protein [Saprospiraceae bacterium]
MLKLGHIYLLGIWFSIFLAVPCLCQKAQLDKIEVLNQLRAANTYFSAKWPDVGKTIITNRERASNIWTRAVYYEGLMKLYSIDPQPEYYKYAKDWAEFHNWNLRDGITFTRNADNQCAGQTYIDLYQYEPFPHKIEKIKASIDSMMHSEKIDDWSWIDAVQMAMPVFAKLGVIFQDQAYWDRMYEMYMFTRNKTGGNGLYNPKDGLWWRDADFDPPYVEPNGEDCYWARGNGWIVMALARVLEIIPEDEAHRKQYEEDFKTMMKALLKVQRKDLFWNVSLHDSGHFGGKETSGTSMFLYGLTWGINHGYFKSQKFKKLANRTWNSLTQNALHANGFLGFVQSTGKEPSDGQPLSYEKMPDFEDFALGAFLMAGSEIYRMNL